ncbi:CDP-diacylglycerol--serine O-phosphatidyltransferase [Fusibacter sp. JL298sf-3]
MESLTKKIPNGLTLANLCLGVASIMLITENNGTAWPAVFILIASVLDTLDGKLARSLNAQSQLGKELDSLCDLVTFGVAPAVMLWHSALSSFDSRFAVVVLLYVASGAYRLARYNASEDCTVFSGMPITCGGILLALYYLTSYRYDALPTALLMGVLAVAMVSRVRFKRIDDFNMICRMRINWTYYKCKRMSKRASR